MISKISAIVAAAVVLMSASVASAQTNRHVPRGQWYAPYANSYYNQDTGNLRYGHASDPVFDSYGGTR